MSQILPVNGHLLIEPFKHESFMASQKGTYEEVGIILATPSEWQIGVLKSAEVGDKVFFDSWMCAKYPKNDTEFYWLVPWSEVRAIEHGEIPK